MINMGYVNDGGCEFRTNDGYHRLVVEVIYGEQGKSYALTIDGRQCGFLKYRDDNYYQCGWFLEDGVNNGIYVGENYISASVAIEKVVWLFRYFGSEMEKKLVGVENE